MVPSDDHEQSQRVYEEGLEHLKARRWAEAVRCSQEALSLRLDFPEAEELLNDAQRGQKAQLDYDLGLRFTEQGRWEEGIARLEEANASGFDFPDLSAKLKSAKRQQDMESLHKKALQHEKAGQWTEAVATLEKLYELDNNYERAGERLAAARDELELQELYERCHTQIERKNWGSALDIIREIERKRPDYPNIRSLKFEAENNIRWERWAKEATHHEHEEDWEEAFALYKEILQQNPDFPGLPERLTEARRQRDLKAAYERAENYLKQEEWEQAREGLDWVLVQAPGYKEAEAKRETAENALESYKRLDEVDRYLEADRLAEARKTLDEASRLVPSDSSLHERLVKTQERFEEQERERKQAIANELQRADEAFAKGSLVEAQRILLGVKESYPGYEEKEIEYRLGRIEEGLRPRRPKWTTRLTYMIGALAGIAGILAFLFGEGIFKDIFVGDPTATPTVMVELVPEPTPTPTETPTSTPTDKPSPNTSTPAPVATPAALPTSTVTPTPIPTPDAVVNTAALNLRSGPDTVYDVLGVLKQGDPLKVTGKCPAGDWLKVIAPGRQEGWVACSLLQVSVDMAGVPVIQAPSTPTPMYTPTPTETPTPELLPAPILTEPENGASFIGPVLLKWQWDKPRAPDELFSVRVYREGETEPCHHAQARDTQYWGDLTRCNAGKHYWSVALVRDLAPWLPEDDENRWQNLSRPSEEQCIYYTPGEEPWEPSGPSGPEPTPTRD
jgi:hypothetical protein